MSLIISEHRKSHLLLIIILSRSLAEVLNTFIWDRANYIWSTLFLCSIPLILWPFLVMISRRNGNILSEYLPILLFLAFLLIRTNYGSLYSLKCFSSDLIVWFSFIFTIESCRRDFESALKLRRYIIYVAKLNVCIGLIQLIAAFFSAGVDNLFSIMDMRPVYGIFDHPNTYLICILPFSLYFFKRRVYGWLFLTLITCVFTGTRGPFIAVLCILLLVLKSALNKSIKKRTLYFRL